MSLGYLSAINVQQITSLQMALRALSQNRKWPAADPGRVDGVLDAQTANAVFAVVSAAPYIPDTVKTVLRALFGLAAVQGDLAVKIAAFIESNINYITKGIQALTIVQQLRSPGGVAPPPPPAQEYATSGGADGGFAASISKLPIGVKIGVPAALALLLVAK